LVRNESEEGPRISPWLVRDAHHAQTPFLKGPRPTAAVEARVYREKRLAEQGAPAIAVNMF